MTPLKATLKHLDRDQIRATVRAYATDHGCTLPQARERLVEAFFKSTERQPSASDRAH